MPSHEDLHELARTWLRNAHQLYPDLVKQGVIPPLSEATVDQLCTDFVRCFVHGEPNRFDHELDPRVYNGVAAGYFRYSDDNSSAKSLDDQLTNAMRKAKAEKRFLPWNYCFADASVSARSTLRRGYRLAKEALERYRDSPLDTLYIEDFSRATREAVETYRLAKLLEKLGCV